MEEEDLDVHVLYLNLGKAGCSASSSVQHIKILVPAELKQQEYAGRVRVWVNQPFLQLSVNSA